MKYTNIETIKAWIKQATTTPTTCLGIPDTAPLLVGSIGSSPTWQNFHIEQSSRTTNDTANEYFVILGIVVLSNSSLYCLTRLWIASEKQRYNEMPKQPRITIPKLSASLMTTPLIINHLQISKTLIGYGLETSCLRRSALFQYVKYLMQR